MSEFKPLPWYKELFIKKSELPEYYVKKRAYLSTHGDKLSNFKFQSKFHNILMKGFSINRKYVDKQNYAIIADKTHDINGPVIYAVTHIGKFDYQIITEALKVHTIPFAGDPELTYRQFDGAIFNLNGVVYIDTNSKTDRKVAYQTSLDVLRNGYNLLIFPEGIWNLSPNNIVEPLYPGVINMSIETNSQIVPVAIEQYGSDFLINIGENYSITDITDIDKNRFELRDKMATLKYEIFENYPSIQIREELGTYEELKKEFIETRLNEYKNPKTKEPYFTEEFIENRVYKEKGVTKPKDAFSYFDNVELNEKTEFMFQEDESLPKEIQESNANKMKR